MVQPKTEEPIRAVKEENESFTKSTVGPNQVQDTLVKTLGVCWDTASDEISFDFADPICTQIQCKLPRDLCLS